MDCPAGIQRGRRGQYLPALEGAKAADGATRATSRRGDHSIPPHVAPYRIRQQYQDPFLRQLVSRHLRTVNGHDKVALIWSRYLSLWVS